jgi:hypothetical protein
LVGVGVVVLVGVIDGVGVGVSVFVGVGVGVTIGVVDGAGGKSQLGHFQSKRVYLSLKILKLC